jgi:hypothetical protein
MHKSKVLAEGDNPLQHLRGPHNQLLNPSTGNKWSFCTNVFCSFRHKVYLAVKLSDWLLIPFILSRCNIIKESDAESDYCVSKEL